MIRRLSIALVLLALLVPLLPAQSLAQTATGCVPSPSGSVSWWPGDGTTNDIVGGNTGTLKNGAMFDSGKVGQGFTFDGVDDAVSIGNPSSLQLQTFTIEAWIKRANTSQISKQGEWGHIFSYDSGGYALGLRNDGRLYLTKVWFSEVISGGPKVTDTSFHHVAVTKSGSTVIFYVDGVPSPTSQYDPGFSFTTNAAIGARGDLVQSFWGSIDEVAIYNRALSSSEIQSISAAGSAGKCKTATPPVVTPTPTFIPTPAPTTTPSYIAPPLTVACLPSPNGLVGWWPGDGNPNDIVGSNTGTLKNGAMFDTGKVGQGFTFDGVDDVVSIANSPSLQLQTFTIDVWIKRASPSQISKDGGIHGNIFMYGINGHGLGMRDNGTLYLTKVGVSEILSGGPKVTDTSFHHVAVTKSGSTVVFYVDGVPSPQHTYDPGFTFTTNIAIGSRGDFAGNVFWGSIDEVAIYNRALSSSEIQSIYAAGSAGKCKTTTPPVVTPTPTPATPTPLPPPSGTTNLALNKPAQQSSTYMLSKPADARGGVDGIKDGTFGFHTNQETNPWWQVDLQSISTLSEIRIFNRLDCCAERAGTLQIRLSNDGANWTGVLSNAGFVFGGVDGKPLIYKVEAYRQARYVRLQLNEYNFLHLDEVEIWGTPGGTPTPTPTYGPTPPPPPPPGGCVPSPSGLLSWWPGDGNTNDIANSITGILRNGATFDNGKVGQGFTFDGVDDTVLIGNSGILQLQTLTIEAWIKRANPTQISKGGGIWGAIFQYGQNGYGLGMRDEGTLYFTKVGVNEVTSGTLRVTDTNFHHVAVTKTGSTVTFYVDGVPSVASSYDPGFSFTTNAAIGAHGGTFANGFWGNIDEVAIYNRVLSASEIMSIAYAGGAGKCKTVTPPIPTVTPQPTVTPPPQPTTTPTATPIPTSSTLSVEDRTAAPNGTVTVPVRLTRASQLRSLNFSLRYDPNVLKVNRVDAGDLVGGALFQPSTRDAGIIRFGVVVQGTTWISGDGPVAHVVFTASGSSGSQSSLTLGDIIATDAGGTRQNLNLSSGRVTISVKLKGDYDGDGRVTMKDALAALQMSVGDLPQDLNLDMDSDGRVTADDVYRIMAAALG